jgi:hypothetical protein
MCWQRIKAPPHSDVVGLVVRHIQDFNTKGLLAFDTNGRTFYKYHHKLLFE